MRLGKRVGLLGALLMLSLPLAGQQLDLTGPNQLGRCYEGTFTILLTNDTPQTFSQIVITLERPNADFTYVAGSSTITLHDGTPVQADPAESGLDLVWDIDSLLGYAYELPPGGNLTVEFRLLTNCSTVSGTFISQATGTGFQTSPSDSLSVEILPGAVRIYKTPSVQEAHVGDTVTWTITVENTGLGPIKNVVVTDVLGSGLAYVSSTPAGTVNGQEITWDLGEILAGNQVQVQLSAQVVACEGLDNNADVRFGCDDGSICFDTAVDGGTATASILLIVDNPLLEFTPPEIFLPYCDPGGTTVTMPVTNTGAGPAKNVRICVDFPATFSIQDVQGGASWDGSCFHLPDLAPGETFDLVFDVVYTGDWCAGGPSGTLYWQTVYENVCGDEFRPPAEFSNYGTDYGPDGPPSISVSLTGDEEVYICTEHTYNLAADFSGLNSCGGGTTSDISVEVDVPQGFVVTDPGTGTWTPGGDGTGGTITWTTSPDTPLNTSFTLRAPGSSQCGQLATLTATATATDCCGCALSATDSVDIAIECYELVTATREASTTTQEKCGAITYTNTYQFADDPALDAISFDELTFIEDAANFQDYVEGSLIITIDGAAASPISIVDNTPGGTFEIQGIDDTRSVRGHTLVISYQLQFTADSQPTSCPSSYTFYDWGTLDFGPDCATGDECTEPCQNAEVLQITTATPSMSVSVTGLPSDFVDSCGTYDVTLTLTKTSDFDPYNVKLQLDSSNYYIENLGAIQVSGVQPTSITPTDYGTYYEWDFGDAFVGQPNGAQSVLTFQVRKRCNPGLDLTATALFEDSCGYSSCSVSDSDAPSYMRQPLLYIYKTPEVIYATENTVTWTIYVINGGAGPAYEVWVDDILGAGLVYDSSVVDPDVVTYPNQDHTGAAINGVSWYIPEIAPGGSRTITLVTELVACGDLTDQVQAGVGCGGEDCLVSDPDASYVLIPDSIVIATSYTDSPMDSCTEQYATITIRNAGDPAVYHLTASQTLPPGLSYVPGTTEWQVDGGGWQAGGDPTIVGSTLTWSETEISGLAELPSRTTLEIRFLIHAGCPFQGGDMPVQVNYETVCGASAQADVGSFYLDYRAPALSVTKRQVSPPSGSPLDCGAEITWEIEVTNTGDATADYVWIEDTLGSGLSYVSSTGDGVYAVDDGYNSGQVVTWALEDLPSGATATLTLTARDNGICGDLSNTVRAWWGCGDDLDVSSATPDYTCLTDTPAETSITASRDPAVDISAELSPTEVPACGTATLTLTLTNPSTATANAIDLRLTLPPGLSYVPGTTEIDCGTGFAPASDPVISGQTLTWYDEADTGNNLCDEISPGGTARLRFQVQASCYLTAQAADITVWYYDCCFETQHSSSASTPITPALPELSITKSPGNVALDCHDPSDTVTWTITVTNTGDVTADWVRVEDTLGEALVYVGSNPPATDLGGGTYAWEFGPLGPGESRSFEITVYLSRPADDCSTSLRTDTARATWGCGTPDGDPTSPEECESGILVQDSAIVIVPDLTLGPGDLAVSCNGDDTFTVTADVHNTGDADASGVSIHFYVDGSLAHTTTATIPAGGDFQESFVTPPLKCGETHTFRVVVDEEDEICECDETDNEATAVASCPCPALVTEKEVAEIRRGGIPISPALPVQAGDVIRYRLSVTNVGGGRAFDVDLSDTLPVEFLYIAGTTSASWPGGSYSADPTGAPGPALSWDTSAELGPGETLVLEFEAVVTSAIVQGEVYTNTMCATGVEGDGTPIPADNSSLVPADTDPDDCDSVSHVAAAVPALSVDKEIVDVLRNGVSIWPIDAVEPGDLIHYRFTIRSVGEGIAYNVDFTDELPPGLEYDTDYAPGAYTVDDPAQSGDLGIPDGATGHLVADISAQLNAGGTLVADFYAYVTSAVQQGVDLENYATATGEDGYGTPIPPANAQIGDSSDDDPDDPDPDDTGLAVIGVREPALALEKEIVDVLRGRASVWPTETVLPEDVIVYRVEVRNVGLGTAYDVDFTDDLPPGLEYDTAYGEGTYAVDAPPQAGTLPIPDGAMGHLVADITVELAPGATMVIEYRARVRPDATPGAILENLARATGVDGAGTEIPEFNTDTDDTYPDRDSTRIRVGIPALVTEKAVWVDPCGCEVPSLEPGSELRLVLSVKNVGYSTAYDIVLRDILPQGLSYVPKSATLFLNGEQVGTQGPVLGGEGQLLWSTGFDLAPGDTLEVIFTVCIGVDVPLGTVLEDVFEASGVDDLSRPIPADASSYVPADTDPDDASSLRLKVGDPSWIKPPPTCPAGEGGEG